MVRHMQNSQATFYTFVVTVVILWPHYKVEHHPQIHAATYMSQHLRFLLQVWWTNSYSSSRFYIKMGILVFMKKKKKNRKPQQRKKSLSLFTSVYKRHACDSTGRGWHLIAIRHDLPGFQEIVEGLCQDLSMLLLNPEVIKLPKGEEDTPNNQMVAL